MALKFSSRFSKHRPNVSWAPPARITATYTDTAKVEGLSINLADLRELVEAVQDWPSTARVDVRRTTGRELVGAAVPKPYIGIVITAKEAE